MKERILYKLNSIIITLIFCITIFVPFSVGVMETDKDVSKIEKRKLSKFPGKPQNSKEIEKIPKLFDAYYSDHFGFRDWFTEYYKLVKFNLGDSPSKDVTIGKDGWLFLGSIKKGYTGFRDPIGDVRNVNLYSKKDLIKLAEYMSNLKLWLKEKEIEYVFIIAPNKHTIYFDKLPGYISKVNKYSSTDQLVEYLRMHTTINVVDLREALIRGKNKYDLYYKTGTHWNFMGGNIAQYEIMKTIQNIFPKKISPKLYDTSIFQFDIATDRGLENMSGISIKPKTQAPYPVFEPNTKQVTDYPKGINGEDIGKTTHTNINLNQKLNAVIFRDSFFRVLEPYFIRKFKRSTYIWGKLNYPSLVKNIDLEKTDIVIEEWVERSLPYMPKTIPEFNKIRNKKIFNNSTDLIFSNDWKRLKFNKYINTVDVDDDFINLKSTGNDPIMGFPLLPFQLNNKYIFHITMTSSISSTLQLFYSDKNNSGYPFSDKHLIQVSIKKGNNDIYILIDYPNIGKHLRLDPIAGEGEVTIKSIDIKTVKK